MKKIVAVAACPTGVAHTYMAQEALEEEAKNRGYDIQVETQGSIGIENELSQKQIDKSDIVILAISVGIDGIERFREKEEQKKIIKIDPSEAIKKPNEVFDKIEEL